MNKRSSLIADLNEVMVDWFDLYFDITIYYREFGASFFKGYVLLDISAEGINS